MPLGVGIPLFLLKANQQETAILLGLSQIPCQKSTTLRLSNGNPPPLNQLETTKTNQGSARFAGNHPNALGAPHSNSQLFITCAKDLEIEGDHLLGPCLKMDHGKTKVKDKDFRERGVFVPNKRVFRFLEHNRPTTVLSSTGRFALDRQFITSNACG